MSQASDFAELQRWLGAAGERASLLRWYRTIGYARHDEVGVVLRDPPAASVVSGNDIEYLPGDALRVDGRPMTPAECDAIHRMLVQMSSDARDAAGGHSTVVVVVRDR